MVLGVTQSGTLDVTPQRNACTKALFSQIHEHEQIWIFLNCDLTADLPACTASCMTRVELPIRGYEACSVEPEHSLIRKPLWLNPIGPLYNLGVYGLQQHEANTYLIQRGSNKP